MKKQNLIPILFVGIALLGVTAIFFYLKNVGNQIVDIIFGIFVFLLVLGSTIIGVQKTWAHRKKLPVEDELSKYITWKSGAYAYYSTVWLAVALLWYNTYFVDNYALPVLSFEHVIGFIVMIPGVIFIVLALYFNTKGNL